MHQKIIILDFGSQYTQLIARRVRESGVYSEIHPCTLSAREVAALEPHGLILSGGPCSVYDSAAPQIEPALLDLEQPDGSPLPILGICYGLQAMAQLLGGSVERAFRREFGRAELLVDDASDLLAGLQGGSTVRMSHGDHLTALPEGYQIIAHTVNAPVA
ncbi:MAG: glutamine amidotransferase-related protein, partial [Bacteroidota bacterium]